MATFTNHVTLHGAANGTTSHSVNPASGTVLAGTAFTPTAGRLLVVITYGSVTSTTPSGWTLEASAVNSGGLYIWSRTAAGGDTFSTTHNGSNYEVGFTILEFPAGSTWVNDITATNTTAAGANPNLTGLTGTNWVGGAKGLNTNAAVTGTWSGSVVELADISQTAAATDGFWLSVGYTEDYTGTSFQPTCTQTGGAGTSESVTFAVNVASGGASASPADSLGIADSATRAVAATRAPGDPVGITDSADRTVAADRSQPDGVGVTDSVAAALARDITLSDSIGITDAAARVVSLDRTAGDTVGLTDSAQTTGAGSVTPADTAGITDNVTVALAIARTIGDQVGATDSASADLTAPGSAELNDPLGVTDLLATTAQILRSAADNLGITDTVTVALERSATRNDPVGMTDSVTVQAGAAPNPTDTLGLTDSAVAVLERVVVISDTVGATDGVGLFNPSVPPLPTDGVSLTVSAEQRGLTLTGEARDLEVST